MLETRKRILDTARAFFETERFELLTIEQIAQQSKVSAPTIYILFQSCKTGSLL
ncbi:MAG: TetR family transcriptional regulator [Verrucomicrobia bacterium]|nr:TetR family transcriptional regulator [Verrucomicrobiota bacterium]